MYTLKQATLAAGKAIMKSPIAIYEMLAVSASDKQISMTACNGEIGITAIAPFDGEAFQCCVPGIQFINIIAATEKPTLKMNGDKLVVSDRRSRFSVNTLPFDNHPGIPQNDVNDTVVTMPGDFNEMLRAVAYASGKNDGRYYLNGVLAESTGSLLSAVATDGHRLAKMDIPATVPPFKFIIPIRSIATLITINAETTEIGSVLTLRNEDVTISTKAISSKYPSWRTMIPSDRPACEADKNEFVDAVKTLNKLKEDDAAHMVMQWSDNGLQISSHGAHVDESGYTFDCQADSVGEFSANIKYFADIASTIKSDTIRFEYDRINSAEKALTIEDGDILHLLMPIRK
ncbi:MAG: DNA polymerase III subunit beta [Methylococcaceae bacterium]